MVAVDLAVILKVKCFENTHLHINFTSVSPFPLYLNSLEHPTVIRITVQGCKYNNVCSTQKRYRTLKDN